MLGYFFYRLGRFLAVRMPLKAGYRLAVCFSLLQYYLSTADRRAVIGNLKKILSVEEQPKIRVYAKAVFINFGKYLIEFFRFPLLKKHDLCRSIKVKGLEYIDRALADGKGVIVLTAHFGNWELGGACMSLLGYPMLAVALPHRHRKVNAFFNRQRQSSGVVVVASVGLALKNIYEALRKNKIVALVGDRDFASSGERMYFFGASKIFPRGPALLAQRTGAKIIPGFVIRQDDDTHVLEFSAPLTQASGQAQAMSDCVKVIEAKIRQYPSQWLMFREFWKE